MKFFRLLTRREYRLAIVMGFVDGILTAMLLAAGRILRDEIPMTFPLALRIATGALATAGFVFYIGRYSELRSQLVRSEAQLNLTHKGKLATTHLGRKILYDAIREASLSGFSSFISALLPLTLAAIFPSVPLLSIIVSLLILGIMGRVIGKAVRGSPDIWAINLIAGGILMTVVGFWLHLV